MESLVLCGASPTGVLPAAPTGGVTGRGDSISRKDNITHTFRISYEAIIRDKNITMAINRMS